MKIEMGENLPHRPMALCEANPGLCRTYGAHTDLASRCPSPYGLGYVSAGPRGLNLLRGLQVEPAPVIARAPGRAHRCTDKASGSQTTERFFALFRMTTLKLKQEIKGFVKIWPQAILLSSPPGTKPASRQAVRICSQEARSAWAWVPMKTKPRPNKNNTKMSDNVGTDGAAEGIIKTSRVRRLG